MWWLTEQHEEECGRGEGFAACLQRASKQLSGWCMKECQRGRGAVSCCREALAGRWWDWTEKCPREAMGFDLFWPFWKLLGKKGFLVGGGKREEEFGLVQINKRREMESRGCRYITNSVLAWNATLVCHPSNTSSPLVALKQASVSRAKAEAAWQSHQRQRLLRAAEAVP